MGGIPGSGNQRLPGVILADESVSLICISLHLLILNRDTLLLGEKKTKSLVLVDQATLKTKTISASKFDKHWPKDVENAAYCSGLAIITDGNDDAVLFKINVEHATVEYLTTLNSLSTEVVSVSRKYYCYTLWSDLHVHDVNDIEYPISILEQPKGGCISLVDIRGSKAIAITSEKMIYWWDIKGKQRLPRDTDQYCEDLKTRPYRTYKIDPEMIHLSERTLLKAAADDEQQTDKNIQNLLRARRKAQNQIVKKLTLINEDIAKVQSGRGLLARISADYRYIAIGWSSTNRKIPIFYIYDADNDLKCISSFTLDVEEIKDFGRLKDFNLDNRAMFLFFQQGFCRVCASEYVSWDALRIDSSGHQFSL